jgi:hypothetical protein
VCTAKQRIGEFVQRIGEFVLQLNRGLVSLYS